MYVDIRLYVVCTCRVQVRLYFIPLVGPETPVATPSTDSVETTAEATHTTSDSQPASGKVTIYIVYISEVSAYTIRYLRT